MNWLGAGLPSFLGALVGAWLGAWLHALLLRHGIDFPPIIALLASLCAILPSKAASGLRGILVASLSCWSGAIAEVLAAPREGLFWDLVHFSDRLTALRLALYVACALVGIFLGSRARPGKGRMLAA